MQSYENSVSYDQIVFEEEKKSQQDDDLIGKGAKPSITTDKIGVYSSEGEEPDLVSIPSEAENSLSKVASTNEKPTTKKNTEELEGLIEDTEESNRIKGELYRDIDNPEIYYQIVGLEFLPKEFAFLNLNVIETEEELRNELNRIISPEDKTYSLLKEKMKEKMRNKDEYRTKVFEYLEKWYFKYNRRMSKEELDFTAELLNLNQSKIGQIQNLFLKRQHQTNLSFLKMQLAINKNIVNDAIKVPKNLKSYFQVVQHQRIQESEKEEESDAIETEIVENYSKLINELLESEKEDSLSRKSSLWKRKSSEFSDQLLDAFIASRSIKPKSSKRQSSLVFSKPELAREMTEMANSQGIMKIKKSSIAAKRHTKDLQDLIAKDHQLYVSGKHIPKKSRTHSQLNNVLRRYSTISSVQPWNRKSKERRKTVHPNSPKANSEKSVNGKSSNTMLGYIDRSRASSFITDSIHQLDHILHTDSKMSYGDFLDPLDLPRRVTSIFRNKKGESVVTQKLKPTLVANEYYYQVINDHINREGERQVSVLLKNENNETVLSNKVPVEKISQSYSNIIESQKTSNGDIIFRVVDENDSEVIIQTLKSKVNSIVQKQSIYRQKRSTTTDNSNLDNTFNSKPIKTKLNSVKNKKSDKNLYQKLKDQLKVVLMKNRQQTQLEQSIDRDMYKSKESDKEVVFPQIKSKINSLQRNERVTGYREVRDERGSTISCTTELSSVNKKRTISKLRPVLVDDQYYHQIVEEKTDKQGKKSIKIETFNERGDCISSAKATSKKSSSVFYTAVQQNIDKDTKLREATVITLDDNGKIISATDLDPSKNETFIDEYFNEIFEEIIDDKGNRVLSLVRLNENGKKKIIASVNKPKQEKRQVRAKTTVKRGGKDRYRALTAYNQFYRKPILELVDMEGSRYNSVKSRKSGVRPTVLANEYYNDVIYEFLEEINKKETKSKKIKRDMKKHRKTSSFIQESYESSNSGMKTPGRTFSKINPLITGSLDSTIKRSGKLSDEKRLKANTEAKNDFIHIEGDEQRQAAFTTFNVNKKINLDKDIQDKVKNLFNGQSAFKKKKKKEEEVLIHLYSSLPVEVEPFVNKEVKQVDKAKTQSQTLGKLKIQINKLHNKYGNNYNTLEKMKEEQSEKHIKQVDLVNKPKDRVDVYSLPKVPQFQSVKIEKPNNEYDSPISQEHNKSRIDKLISKRKSILSNSTPKVSKSNSEKLKTTESPVHDIKELKRRLSETLTNEKDSLQPAMVKALETKLQGSDSEKFLTDFDSFCKHYLSHDKWYKESILFSTMFYYLIHRDEQTHN